MLYIYLLVLHQFLTALQQLPFCTDVEALALDKTVVSGLNQARILFDTILATASPARLQLPPEHSQLAATTKKIFDITKAAAAATTPPNAPTSDKKDVSVSLRPFYFNTSLIIIFAVEPSAAAARSTSPPSTSPLLKTRPKTLHTTQKSL